MIAISASPIVRKTANGRSWPSTRTGRRRAKDSCCSEPRRDFSPLGLGPPCVAGFLHGFDFDIHAGRAARKPISKLRAGVHDET
jgi:hypothetical protein